MALVVSGCFDENNPVIDGPPMFGFHDEGASVNVWEAGGEEGTTGSYEAVVHLMAPQQPEDIQARLEVIADETDAEEGVHYALSGEHADGVVTMPANTSIVTVDIELPDANMTPGESRTLFLQLTEGITDGVEVSPNFSTYEITIHALEADVDTDANTYDFEAVEAGADSTQTVTITNEGNRTSELSDFEITGDGADAFSHDAEETYTLGPDESIELEVTFAPAQEGEFEADFSFVWTNGTTDPDGDTFTAVLAGATPDIDDNGNGGNDD